VKLENKINPTVFDMYAEIDKNPFPLKTKTNSNSPPPQKIFFTKKYILVNVFHYSFF